VRFIVAASFGGGDRQAPLVSTARMFRSHTRACGALALLGAIVGTLCPRAVLAHHDASDAAASMGLSDAGAIDASMGGRQQGGSSLGLSLRYLATELAPMLGGSPVAVERDYLVTQLSFEHDLNARFRLRAGLPSVTALPTGDTELDAGIGDVRVGSLYRMPAGTLRVHGAMDLSMPTGDTALGFGQGAFLGRLAAGLAGSWAETLSLSAELGLSQAFRDDTGLSLDYGISSTWQVRRAFSLAFQARAMTALVDRLATNNLVLQQPREAGATMLVLMPSGTAQISDRWSVFGGPQIPIGRNTFGFGVVVGVQSVL